MSIWAFLVGGGLGYAVGATTKIEARRRANPDAKVHLERVRLDRGGYDEDGKYWGAGEPLYVYYSDDLEWGPMTGHAARGVGGYLRASSRAEAKEEIRRKHPEARFYR